MERNQQIEYRIARLIVRFLENTISEKELEELNDWRYASEDNMVLFHELAQNPERNYFVRTSMSQKFNKQQNWIEISKQIKRKKRKKQFEFLMKLAAVFVVLVVSGVFLYHISRNTEKLQPISIAPGSTQAMLVTSNGDKYVLSEKLEIEENGVKISTHKDKVVYEATLQKKKVKAIYNTIVVPKGGEYRLKLIDGTMVWLNSDSKLRYPTAFNSKNRKVYLEGEALFKVAKDKQHPFIVDVNSMLVKVLGTTFNVNAYADQNKITTTLVEGKVKVESDFFEKEAYLSPNNQYQFNSATGESEMTMVNTAIYTAWARGRFVFEKENLRNIMIRLERWYNVKIFFTNQKLAEMQFSGDIARYEDINEVLNLLAKTKKVKFQLNGRNLMVMPIKK